jgi:hypothetical protein
MVEFGSYMLNGGTRRKRGRRQRGGFYFYNPTEGGTRRNRGRRQRGGVNLLPYVELNAGGTRRKRGRRQRGGTQVIKINNGGLG